MIGNQQDTAFIRHMRASQDGETIERHGEQNEDQTYEGLWQQPERPCGASGGRDSRCDENIGGRKPETRQGTVRKRTEQHASEDEDIRQCDDAAAAILRRAPLDQRINWDDDKAA